MANPEHIEILKQGVEAWNKWRDSGNNDVKPDLAGANLDRAYLSGVDLVGANLQDAYLNDANLSNASLGFAILHRTNLRGADLSHADIFGARLHGAVLDGANLSYAILLGADLTRAILSDTRLIRADLGDTNLNLTYLSGANLSGANLGGAALISTWLGNANLSQANMGRTVITDVDFSGVKNLESVKHFAPSSIGIDTIYESRGRIPDKFLRGCGVPEDFITYMRSLTAQSTRFYKSFISYSSKDRKFANQLYADLQNKGVRCWLASEDLKIGDRIRVRIDEAIRLHDKLLLVLSRHSVTSDWVEQEVEAALARERKEKRTVLFPIRLDDAVMEVESGWPALVRNTRNIGDFRKWKQHDSYQNAFDRLLRDLKAEA